MSERRFRPVVFSLLGFALLSGCATNVSYSPFSPQPGESIRSIAVLSVPSPASSTINNFGSLGGGIGAAMTQSKYRDPFTNLLHDGGFDFGKEMHAAIVDRLKAAGYKVIAVHSPKTNTAKLHDDYTKVPTAGADAVLDLATGVLYGYSNVDMIDNKFRPHIHLSARLISARTKKPLYAEEIMYGYTNMFMKVTELKAPEKFFYAEPDDVIANKTNTIEGMRAGIAAVAGHLAAQLKK